MDSTGTECIGESRAKWGRSGHPRKTCPPRSPRASSAAAKQCGARRTRRLIRGSASGHSPGRSTRPVTFSALWRCSVIAIWRIELCAHVAPVQVSVSCIPWLRKHLGYETHQIHCHSGDATLPTISRHWPVADLPPDDEPLSWWRPILGQRHVLPHGGRVSDLENLYPPPHRPNRGRRG